MAAESVQSLAGAQCGVRDQRQAQRERAALALDAVGREEATVLIDDLFRASQADS